MGNCKHSSEKLESRNHGRGSKNFTRPSLVGRTALPYLAGIVSLTCIRLGKVPLEIVLLLLS